MPSPNSCCPFSEWLKSALTFIAVDSGEVSYLIT
jgi:hypothetical protein